MVADDMVLKVYHIHLSWYSEFTLSYLTEYHDNLLAKPSQNKC